MPFTSGDLTKSTFSKGPESHKLFSEFIADDGIHVGQPCVMHADGGKVSPAVADEPEQNIVGISIHEGRSAYKDAGRETVVLAMRGFAIINAVASAAIVPGPVTYDGYDVSEAYLGNQETFGGYNKVKALAAALAPVAPVAKRSTVSIAGLGASAQVDTLTFPALGTKQIDVLTIDSTANTTQADYVLLTNAAGQTVAVWMDIDANGTAPTGAAYVGADEQIMCSIITGGVAIGNDQLFANAIETSNWSDSVGVVSNGDGTISLTQDIAAVVAVPVPHDDDDAGAGSIAVSQTTPGVNKTGVQGDYIFLTNAAGETLAAWLDIDQDNTAPVGAAYLGADERVVIECSSGESAAEVAALAKTAIETAAWEDTVTLVDAGGGDLTVTQDTAGIVAVPVPHDNDDAGAGTITTDPTTPGTAAGAGTITGVGALNKAINWAVSDAATVDAFVVANAADYLAAGVVLSNIAAVMYFEDYVAGTGHVTPIFTNTAGTLAGIVEVLINEKPGSVEVASRQFGWALDAAAEAGDIIRVVVKD